MVQKMPKPRKGAAVLEGCSSNASSWPRSREVPEAVAVSAFALTTKQRSRLVVQERGQKHARGSTKWVDRGSAQRNAALGGAEGADFLIRPPKMIGPSQSGWPRCL